MSALTLPEPIAAYFAAEHNPQALAHCFTAQAVMKDDGHTYTGIPAIQAFDLSYRVRLERGLIGSLEITS